MEEREETNYFKIGINKSQRAYRGNILGDVTNMPMIANENIKHSKQINAICCLPKIPSTVGAF